MPADHQLAAAGDLELSLIKAQYREAFVAAGPLTGFALSPDGAEVVLGGAGDGILRL